MPRHRRTDAELAALDALIRSILEPDHPQSVRHVYYRLVDMGVDVPKTEHGYKLVGRRCTQMRRDGQLPYHWLVDSTRRGPLTLLHPTNRLKRPVQLPGVLHDVEG